jgi:hypothetical protein
MSDTPAPSGCGQDEDPPGTPAGPGDHPQPGSQRRQLVRQSPDWPQWMDHDAHAEDEYPGDPDEYQDPGNAPPPGLDDAQLDALIAEARQAGREITADQARMAEAWAGSGHTAAMAAVSAMAAGRRGPGMSGSAESFPGEYASLAAGFASGKPLDTAPGCATLASFLQDMAGDDDRYAGASDDELLGAICGWDRVEANASAAKHAAVAELIRRRPGPGGWDEFTGRELGAVLGLSFGEAEVVLDLAHLLQTRLPGIRALFRSGVVSRAKAAIIANATALLDPEEACAAEAMVLDRAGSLTPAALRAAISRAVMEVNPEEAKKRREHAAKRTRVERWAEDSGNGGLAGRELPPAEVLAADQRVTAWAQQLRQAGLEGGMDALRARAFLDILLGIDSRPLASRPDGTHSQGNEGRGDVPGRDGGGPADPAGPRTAAPAGPLAGVIPPGFAGRATLTIPATTLLDLADRPGEMAGLGPIDPDLARDLAAAAARNPRSTWCVTVTDAHGHAIGHGCARPAPPGRREYPSKPDRPGTPGGPDPPGQPRFTLIPAGQPGPPGGYGTWRFSTGIPGQRDLLLEIGPIPTGGCDHRHEAKGHDPGVLLRHLAQVRHATCTGPGCRRPATRADFEHNTPYEAGGRTCLCNGNPKCRFDHRLKQDPRWNAEQLPNGEIRWTTPSGRQYVTEPTRYPL